MKRFWAKKFRQFWLEKFITLWQKRQLMTKRTYLMDFTSHRAPQRQTCCTTWSKSSKSVKILELSGKRFEISAPIWFSQGSEFSLKKVKFLFFIENFRIFISGHAQLATETIRRQSISFALLVLKGFFGPIDPEMISFGCLVGRMMLSMSFADGFVQELLVAMFADKEKGANFIQILLENQKLIQ